MVLDGATDQIVNDKLSLYLDGVLVGKTEGRRIPQSYIPPRLGGMTYTYGGRGRAVTLFNDEKPESPKPGAKKPVSTKLESCEFKGRLSNFKFLNKAVIPTASQ